MRRWIVLFFAVLLPLQFAWSAASAYCQHESGEQQRPHLGHHVHVHHDQAKTPVNSGITGDPDCASCHAAGTTAVAQNTLSHDFSTATSSAAPVAMLAFSSALARPPDRPQWPRLV